MPTIIINCQFFRGVVLFGFFVNSFPAYSAYQMPFLFRRFLHMFCTFLNASYRVLQLKGFINTCIFDSRIFIKNVGTLCSSTFSFSFLSAFLQGGIRAVRENQPLKQSQTLKFSKSRPFGKFFSVSRTSKYIHFELNF